MKNENTITMYSLYFSFFDVCTLFKEKKGGKGQHEQSINQ